MLRPEDRELDELLDTLGYETIATVVQHRTCPDPKSYIGSGKLLEVAHELKRFAMGQGAVGSAGPPAGGESPGAHRGPGVLRGPGARRSRSASAARQRHRASHSDVDLPRVVVDGALTPSQHHNLERTLAARHGLKVDVRDRFQIVLEIFERRALSKEAKLQVEYARLNYMTPFVKEWFHAAVAGEHPGFMAGGEYGVEEYLRYIRRRTVSIRGELEASEDRGAAERERVRGQGWAIVGLAGYTNAGKSTLFASLSGIAAESDHRMFTTLSPKSAGVTRGGDGRRLPRGRVRILVEDTIGFIEGMPADLIDGFRVTLGRLRSADVTLLLVDASDPAGEVARKLATCLAALGGEGVRNLVPVLTKVDRASGASMAQARKIVQARTGREALEVSPVSGAGLERFLGQVLGSSKTFVEVEVPLAGPAAAPERFPRLASLMVDYRVVPGPAVTSLIGWCRAELVPKLHALAASDDPG